MEFDRFSRLKENMVSAGDGWYVSGQDPRMWQKLLERNPNDGKALYNVGLHLEKEALKSLEKYRETEIVFFLKLYRQKIRHSLETLGKSLDKGYFPAANDILRINKEKKRHIPGKTSFVLPAGAGTVILLLLCFLLGMAVALLFLSERIPIYKEITEEYYTYMLPFEVVQERPGNVPAMDYEIKTIAVGDISPEAIVNELVASVKELYQKQPHTPKKVIAVQKGGSGRGEVGMAVWAGKNSNIKVFVYPGNRKEKLLWETTTVIRSALYQFALQNGCLPDNLEVLTQPFPGNYLTSIPREPYKFNSEVYTAYNGRGGWIYRPEEFDSARSIFRALKPNLPVVEELEFEPLHLFIDKSGNTLSVVSGNNVIRRYSVGLGKDGRTPEGDLYIDKKVVNPNSGLQETKSPYGTRAMELSNPDFAIHGTDVPSSIGRNVTMGCIRLHNDQMEDLYSLVPLYTEVKVYKGEYQPESGRPVISGEAMEAWGPSDNRLYAVNDSPKEENNSIAFRWKG